MSLAGAVPAAGAVPLAAGPVVDSASAVSLPTDPVPVGPTAVDPVPVWLPVVPVPVVPLPVVPLPVPVVPLPVVPVPVPVVPVPVVPLPVPVVPLPVVPLPVPVVPLPVVPLPVPVVLVPVVPSVVAPVDPVAGSAGLATTGGAAAGGAALSVPAVRGALWARTEGSGSVFRLGVVVEVRFGSPGSGGVSAATASSIRCWSTSRVWPSSSRTLGSDVAIEASTCLASSGCRWLSRSWARSRLALTTCAAMIDSARSEKKTLVIAHAGSPGCAVPPLAAAPLTPNAATTTATAARRSGCPGGRAWPGGRVRRLAVRTRESRVTTEAAAVAARCGAPPGPSPGSPSAPWSAGRRAAREGRTAPGVAERCSAVGRRGPISRTVGGSRSGRRSVRPSVSSCSADPASGAPSSEASPPGDPVFGVATSGWPPAATSTPTVSSVGAAVTGRRCPEGPAAATSGSMGCGAAAGSGRALAAHAASMAMSGSSSARSSAPARSPPLRASMSASSARTAARSIGSSLSRGSKSRSSSMSAGPASRSKSTSKSRSPIRSPSRSPPTSSFPIGEAWSASCGPVVRGASDARMPTRSSSAGPPSDPA